jgi:hypothetical protein
MALTLLTVLAVFTILILPALFHSHPRTLDTVRGPERGVVVLHLASDVPSVGQKWTRMPESQRLNACFWNYNVYQTPCPLES